MSRTSNSELLDMLKYANEQARMHIDALEEMVYVAITGDGLQGVVDNPWYQQIARRVHCKKHPNVLKMPNPLARKAGDAQ